MSAKWVFMQKTNEHGKAISANAKVVIGSASPTAGARQFENYNTISPFELRPFIDID